MKITDRIKSLQGVSDCYYNHNNLTLAVYYITGFDLSIIKAQVIGQIDKANLHRSVEKINFYSMED